MAMYGVKTNRVDGMKEIKLSRHGFDANNDSHMIDPLMQRLNTTHGKIRCLLLDKPAMLAI
jgi:hypothetical protein